MLLPLGKGFFTAVKIGTTRNGLLIQIIMPKFSIGDIVVLKSDQDDNFPIYMTVEEIDASLITCVWRVDKGFSNRTFPEDTLVKCNN